jgi:hypothetical protein
MPECDGDGGLTMRIVNRFAIFVLLLASASPLGITPARASGADWPPIDPNELALKDNPASSGSLAMVLYREELVNSRESTENYYYRIKIFTEEGKKRGDIGIPFYKGLFEIKDIHARTIHPDGKIIDFNGQVLDKLVVKAGDIKVQEKTFTLPDVTPGSIIEYRYKTQGDPNSYYNVFWRIQEDLFTKRAHFVFQPYDGSGAPALLWRSAHLQAGVAPQKLKNGSWTLDVNDVPGLPDEDYMLPEDELRGLVEFIYTYEEHPKDAKQYWDTVAKDWIQKEDAFIGKRGSIRDQVSKLVSNDDSPEAKLRKLYARAQQIHNVDADREKTAQETRREKNKDNNNVEDVLKHGSGDSGDIDYFFVALAQAAGFDSGLIWIAPRNERRFEPGLQDKGELSDYLAWVHAGDKDYFLDPGASLCPFGMLPWYETSITGLRPTKQGAVFVPVPMATVADSAIERRALLKLDESDGTMSGDLVITYTGQRALARRRDARNQDETGKNKIVTDEVKTWFPTNAKFELISITGWDTPDVPLEVKGKLTLPGMAESVGRRVLLPLGLYEAGRPQMFQTTSRKQDIYFHFPFAEHDDITIQVPKGWHAESLPDPDVINPGGNLRYEISAKQEGDALHVQRKLIVGGILYPIDSYNAVRRFFGNAKEGDEKQLVLQTTPPSGK